MYLRVHACGSICCNICYAYTCMYVSIVRIRQRNLCDKFVWSENAYFYSKIRAQLVQQLLLLH